MPHRSRPPIGRSARAARSLLVALLLAAGLVTTATRPAAGVAGGHYRPPVDAPITDPFEAPLNPYGPGNRGIQYATMPGTLVLAAGAGVVVYAGSIAYSLYVTILHPDGVRTSYSYLAAILVSDGQSVSLGQPVGVAGSVFQIGARRGDVYFDPATLWGDGLPHVFLVPLDGQVAGDSGDAGLGSAARARARPAAVVPDPTASDEIPRHRGTPRAF